MPDMLVLARDHHAAGRLGQAAALYAEVLSRDPDEPDALHLMGVLHLQRGDAVAAAGLIARAVALRPG